MAIGAGLITTWQIDTGSAKWIGYQVMYGFGMGMCFINPNLATQTALPKPEVPMGMALMFFGQLLGAAVFVSVGENVLVNQLLQRLSGIPSFQRSFVTGGGATELLKTMPAQYRPQVLTAYNETLRKVLQIGLILSCRAVAGVCSMEIKSVLKRPGQGKNAPVAEKKVDAPTDGAATEKKHELAAEEKNSDQKI